MICIIMCNAGKANDCFKLSRVNENKQEKFKINRQLTFFPPNDPS